MISIKASWLNQLLVGQKVYITTYATSEYLDEWCYGESGTLLGVETIPEKNAVEIWVQGDVMSSFMYLSPEDRLYIKERKKKNAN